MIVRMSEDIKKIQVEIGSQIFSYDADAIMKIASQIGEQEDIKVCMNAINALVNFLIDKPIVPGRDYYINMITEEEGIRFFLNMPIKCFEKCCHRLLESEKDQLIRLLLEEYHKLNEERV